jgi:hypothetical protein
MPKRHNCPIERVFVYLDGFNSYNGMVSKGWAAIAGSTIGRS